jgi:hypothetical protein
MIRKTVDDILEAYVLRVNSSGDYAWIVNPKSFVAEFLLGLVDRDIKAHMTCLTRWQSRSIGKAEGRITSRSDSLQRQVGVRIDLRVRARIQIDWRERKAEAKDVDELFCVSVDVRHGRRETKDSMLNFVVQPLYPATSCFWTPR